jgi:hypothetical protein
MPKDELIKIWKEGNNDLFKDNKIDKAMIESYLNTKTLKTSKHFSFNIIFHWFLQLTNIILISMNLFGYKNNPAIFWVLILMQVLSISFLLYGINIFYRLRDINNYSDTLINLLNKQLKYIRTYYEVWLVIISLSTLILIFSLGLIVDYNNGYYPINNKMLFSGIFIGVFLFIYVTQKISSIYFTSSLKAYLIDLRKGIMDESIRIEKNRKKLRWIFALIALILMIIFLAGLFKFI